MCKNYATRLVSIHMRLDFQCNQPERFALGLIANHENVRCVQKLSIT